ncbi:MAG: hypothetical protein ACK41T_01100 [Pseudobdellovibrio sp.]
MKKILEALISKKRIIGWVAALGFGIGAVSLSMSGDEFKKAVCDAQPINLESGK